MLKRSQNSLRQQLPLFIFIAIIALVIWFLLRIVLLLNVGFSQLSISQTLKAFGMGLWLDINALCYLAVPFLLGSVVLPNRWRGQSWFNKARWGLAFLVTFGLIFGAVSEYIFWQELLLALTLLRLII